MPSPVIYIFICPAAYLFTDLLTSYYSKFNDTICTSFYLVALIQSIKIVQLSVDNRGFVVILTIIFRDLYLEVIKIFLDQKYTYMHENRLN